jgi:chemotaxis response regulator CheB
MALPARSPHIAAKIQRVLIVGTGSVLDDGIHQLLHDVPALRVSSIIFTTEDAFLDTLSGVCPDVIVLNEDCPLSSMRIFELLENVTKPIALRVLVLRADDNTIDMYERKQTKATATNDLLALIRNGSMRRV